MREIWQVCEFIGRGHLYVKVEAAQRNPYDAMGTAVQLQRQALDVRRCKMPVQAVGGGCCAALSAGGRA